MAPDAVALGQALGPVVDAEALGRSPGDDGAHRRALGPAMRVHTAVNAVALERAVDAVTLGR